MIAPFTWGAAAGPVHQHVVAGLGDADAQRDGLADLHTIVVDMVLEAPFPVRQVAQRGAGQPLGIVQQLVHVEARLRQARARHQLLEGPLGDGAGRQLRPQVAEHFYGYPHVALDQQVQRGVRHAALVEPQRRDAQAFLVDLRAVRGVRARHPAAHIGVVADGGGDRHAFAGQ